MGLKEELRAAGWTEIDVLGADRWTHPSHTPNGPTNLKTAARIVRGGTTKLVGFEYEVRVSVELPESDVDFLIDLSGRHYDSACRSIGAPGPDAFLNGMKARASDGVASGSLTSRQLNLVLKVLELPHSRPDLVADFVRLFRDIEEESERLSLQA